MSGRTFGRVTSAQPVPEAVLRDFDDYRSGRRLWGDDFAEEQIREWFADEQQAFGDISASAGLDSVYYCHELNRRHLFQHLPRGTYGHCLAIGCGAGQELALIARQVRHITAIEPVKRQWRKTISGVSATYCFPDPTGKIPLPDASVDVVTAFAVLHHIPNVSYVLSEIARVLKPRGILLAREPISSMGDWRLNRPGMTKRERGIPTNIFYSMLVSHFDIIRLTKCSFAPLARLSAALKVEAFNSRILVTLDRALSCLFEWNDVYWRDSFLKRLAPGVLAVVAAKRNSDGLAV